ncbi:armadillo repeat-containing protein 2 isoform X2 [Kryptolebias marmoratus]|uniref:armadillo repeat-containing protein 2 isoform X2 n=1 Tax=Kryptolebias marmoratus TaxID=37003 RepID=UPI0018ACB51C|nr:armadillo repeat-containing protein 2 isoform X2 [Kryptolebias marmoratus]
METNHEICSPFIPRGRSSLRKTCAEIVSESRQSLRVQSTQRPFTPQDGRRQLFGGSCVRADCDSRPPSTFSLHGRNFDASDSRPGSGTRLSPLNHKPKLPAPFKAEDSSKDFPKSPSGPVDTRRGLAQARARLLKPLCTPLPPEASTEVKEKLNPGPEQKQLSAQQLCSPEQSTAHSVPLIPGPCKPPRESKIVQLDVDSRLRPTANRAAQQTELKDEDNATSTKEDAESLVWNNVIVPILEELESMAAGSFEGSVDRLCDLCDGLHGTLADADMLGRRCKRRSKILRTLFRLIDLNSSKLNLHIAKLCLALCVSGNNLLNICKLIFQISRSESNDILFQKNSIIDSLLVVLYSEDVNVSGEALLYCVGTLKFLSGNTAILRLLLDKNCIGVAQKLLLALCRVDDTTTKTAGHILVQLTATLRNLANHPDSRALFVSFSVLPALCQVLRHHREDKDICTNISRIFSKLSSYSECCLDLAQIPNCYPLFLELLRKHHQKQDLVVRLLFTLGNLTAKSDAARLGLFQCNGCTATLLQLYSSYQRRDESPRTPLQKRASSPRKPATPPVGVREADDVLVKLVRVLANVCIHPAVGPSLVTNTTCIQLLMETLELRSAQESEELMVNVAATINNLSFYEEEGSEIRHNRLAIAELMLKLMLTSSMEAVLEATRVYGNLSQHRDVRDFVMQNKVHKFAVTLLDSKRAEMCFSACGVLTNLALDPPKRVSLAQEGASAKLVDCLRDFGAADWQLAAQACQAMWNLTGGGSEELLDSQERRTLLQTLTAYLDEDEALKWAQNEDMRDFHRACWESEFRPVAEKLLKALQSQNLTT